MFSDHPRNLVRVWNDLRRNESPFGRGYLYDSTSYFEGEMAPENDARSARVGQGARQGCHVIAPDRA
jgi:hypothetical protein